MGEAGPSCQPYEARDRMARSTLSLPRATRRSPSSAGVAAIAIGIPITHAAPAGGFRSLPAGRVTGGAGLARLAAPLVHALTGGITGCSGMAGHRAPLLHPLAIVRRRRA